MSQPAATAPEPTSAPTYTDQNHKFITNVGMTTDYQNWITASTRRGTVQGVFLGLWLFTLSLIPFWLALGFVYAILSRH